MLWIEFAVLYIVAPLLLAVALPPQWLFPILFIVTLAGLGLLAVTPGFRWSELWRGWGAVRWPVVLGTAAMTAILCGAVMWWSAPEALFLLIRERPGLMGMIVLLYPVVSVIPQEIVFRPLFFRRYARLLPSGALWWNAALFALAHLMYWSVVVVVMTFAGGLLFAWAYQRRGSFPLAVVLHSIAGIVLFAFGMGVYFYSGNVVRPF